MTKNTFSVIALRAGAALMLALVLLFILNNYLLYWHGMPKFSGVLAYFGLLSSAGTSSELSFQSWIQLGGYAAILIATVAWVQTTSTRSLRDDADLYARAAAYVIRAAYWAVVLIGFVDVLISFLRVENFLEAIIGKYLTIQLGRPVFRGVYVHYPLFAIALVIAWFSKSLGFIWLALLVVIAEFLVVLSRFVFSYEQAFMGDLVRFWYAALFLFASAYTLAHEGHVRVDVLYTNFSVRGKAWANVAGAMLLGLPLCWTIMLQGMSGKSASITGPLLGFEISQSGYGMYVKYMMAGFLLIFAISMMIQFVSMLLDNVANLRDEPSRVALDQST